MGSVEIEPRFSVVLKGAVAQLASASEHRIASWIVARIDFITAGSLAIDGWVCRDDFNDFGFKLKVADRSKSVVGHGAVVVGPDGVHFTSVTSKPLDLQAEFIELLAESPDDLSRCEMFVQHPQTRAKRSFGWNGYSLFEH